MKTSYDEIIRLLPSPKIKVVSRNPDAVVLAYRKAFFRPSLVTARVTRAAGGGATVRTRPSLTFVLVMSFCSALTIVGIVNLGRLLGAWTWIFAGLVGGGTYVAQLMRERLRLLAELVPKEKGTT